MNNNINEKINDLSMENIFFMLFIISALLDLTGNECLKETFLGKKTQEDARNKFILASSLLVVVFAYFAYHNYQRLKEFDENSAEYHYAYIRFIGSLLALIGEAMVLYYFVNTPRL